MGPFWTRGILELGHQDCAIPPNSLSCGSWAFKSHLEERLLCAGRASCASSAVSPALPPAWRGRLRHQGGIIELLVFIYKIDNIYITGLLAGRDTALARSVAGNHTSPLVPLAPTLYMGTRLGMEGVGGWVGFCHS